MTKKLTNILKEINLKIEKLIPDLQKEVQELINSKETDFQRIELTLDYLMYPCLKKQFDTLNSYYETINPEVAKDYQKYYKKMWE